MHISLVNDDQRIEMLFLASSILHTILYCFKMIDGYYMRECYMKHR